MNDQQLRQILLDVDANSPTAQVGHNLAANVRRRAARRRLRRSAVGTTLVVLVAMTIQLTRSRRPVGARQNQTASANNGDPQLLAMAAQVESQVDSQVEMLAQLRLAEKRQALQQLLRNSRSAATFGVNRAIDREATAAMLVAGADQLQRSTAGKPAAGKQYQTVLDSFSETRAALLAGDRLMRLNS